MASRKLEDLHPLVAEKAKQLVEPAEADGIEILVTSTLAPLRNKPIYSQSTEQRRGTK